MTTGFFTKIIFLYIEVHYFLPLTCFDMRLYVFPHNDLFDFFTAWISLYYNPIVKIIADFLIFII